MLNIWSVGHVYGLDVIRCYGTIDLGREVMLPVRTIALDAQGAAEVMQNTDLTDRHDTLDTAERYG
jgi:hypothetical protein